MDRDSLEELVASGLTVRQIAAEVGLGYSTVRYWLRRHGLQTQHRGPGRRAAVDQGAFVCKRHGPTPPVADSHGMRCGKCRSEQIAARRRRVKDILVREAGGRCAICGYDRYNGALQFHHLNPAEKAFHLSISGLTLAIDTLRKEAAKCVLLCSNCHAEVEGGVASLV
jgi:5-methylcytosine-specific restriction endonuclease McrA